MGTPEACARLGVTLRTLYRFIDEGQLPAYKMGRVIRLQAQEVDAFIERARITPGTLEHLYPDPRTPQPDSDLPGHQDRDNRQSRGRPGDAPPSGPLANDPDGDFGTGAGVDGAVAGVDGDEAGQPGR